MGLELNSQGLQQIQSVPNRSGSQTNARNDRSIIKANARNILNIMDDVRQIDQEINKRVRVKKSSVTQRAVVSTDQTSINQISNLSIGNSALSNNRSSRTSNTNNTSNSNISNISSINSSDMPHNYSNNNTNSNIHTNISHPKINQNIKDTNDMIDRNMNKIDALESRNDNINNKLNDNISDINNLLKEINEKLLSGNLDDDEKFV
mmetsp:Transcript_41942/g.35229  ORF Transcript_41942/g.35229 Transcript_41942/m.35229 type:complete len:206 (+) Transcript_41942:1507-2124(+)